MTSITQKMAFDLLSEEEAFALYHPLLSDRDWCYKMCNKLKISDRYVGIIDEYEVDAPFYDLGETTFSEEYVSTHMSSTIGRREFKTNIFMGAVHKWASLNFPDYPLDDQLVDNTEEPKIYMTTGIHGFETSADITQAKSGDKVEKLYVTYVLLLEYDVEVARYPFVWKVTLVVE